MEIIFDPYKLILKINVSKFNTFEQNPNHFPK